MMKLFRVQDPDRPMWVPAKTGVYSAMFFHSLPSKAIALWKNQIAVENEMPEDEVEDPDGVQFVCDEDDFLIDYHGAAADDSAAAGQRSQT